MIKRKKVEHEPHKKLSQLCTWRYQSGNLGVSRTCMVCTRCQVKSFLSWHGKFVTIEDPEEDCKRKYITKLCLIACAAEFDTGSLLSLNYLPKDMVKVILGEAFKRIY